MPLVDTSVTLAGQPSKVGGAVARVFGWTVLAAGWAFAALLAGLILLLGGGWAAAVAAGPIALITSIVAWALLSGGKHLKKSGDDAEQATKNQAIFALARAKNGVLRAWDVAQALKLTPKEGDDILTRLAKEHPEHVGVDLDDDGNILYRFPAIHWGGLPTMAPNAPSPARGAAPHVRVDAPARQARVATDGAPRAEAPEPLDEEDAIAPEAARRNAR